MCGDMLSSKWEIEVQKNHLVDLANPKNHWMRLENRHKIRHFVRDTVIPEFRNAIENKTVREIYWVGGEPLLYDEHWEFMHRIVELGYADQVRVRYNTNLSYINDKKGNLYQLLDNFPHWEICASLDATGAIGEYVRTGLDYNTFVRNIREGIKHQRRPAQIRLDHTLTLPGLADIGGIVALGADLNIGILSKVVFAFTPDIMMSPLALPRHILEPWVDEIILEISDRNRSIVEVLQHLKTRPTFAEQWPDEYQQAARRGKAHIQKLEQIRTCNLNMDSILSAYKPAQDWWRSIDE
jgi:hypothetical protein